MRPKKSNQLKWILLLFLLSVICLAIGGFYNDSRTNQITRESLAVGFTMIGGLLFGFAAGISIKCGNEIMVKA